jgi:hypothetical protein
VNEVAPVRHPGDTRHCAWRLASGSWFDSVNQLVDFVN